MAKTIYTYTLPESIRAEASNGYSLPSKISMKSLTADEELQAHRVGRAEYMRTQYDAAKRSIVAFDGTPVSYADGDVDKFWERCGEKVRSLVLQAYNKRTSPKKEDEDSFFASEEVQQG
jgi:hypothetical protein